MLTRRVLTATAALLMLAVVVLMVGPATSVVPDDGSGRRVNCGTLLFTTDHRLGDGCEDPRIARITTAFSHGSPRSSSGRTGPCSCT